MVKAWSSTLTLGHVLRNGRCRARHFVSEAIVEQKRLGGTFMRQKGDKTLTRHSNKQWETESANRQEGKDNSDNDHAQ